MAVHFSISCQENSMNRGAWWATVHGVTESDTTEHTHATPSLTLINSLFYFQVEASREPVCELTCLGNIPHMGHPTGLWSQSEEYSREASTMTHTELVQLEQEINLYGFISLRFEGFVFFLNHSSIQPLQTDVVGQMILDRVQSMHGGQKLHVIGMPG